jgi:hypothetical protein
MHALVLFLCCRVCDITFMGNSLLDTCGGHSLAQASVSATALLLGPHAGVGTKRVCVCAYVWWWGGGGVEGRAGQGRGLCGQRAQ